MMKPATAKIAIIASVSFHVTEATAWERLGDSLLDNTIADFDCVLRPPECKFPFKLKDDPNRSYDYCLPAGYGQSKFKSTLKKLFGKNHWCSNDGGETKIECPETTSDPKKCMENLVNPRPDGKPLKPESPVLMITGALNSFLYVKDIDPADKCAQYFPKGTRVWPPEAELSSVTIILKRAKRNCWIKLMTLEKKDDGSYDGPGRIKLRVKNTGTVDENVVNLLNPLRDAFVEGAGYVEGVNFYNFPIDFRLSPKEFAAEGGVYSQMIKQIEKMVEKEGGKPATVIGFSMGAQVAVGLLNYAQSKKGSAWMEKHVGNLITTVGSLMGAVDTIQYIHPTVEFMSTLLKPFKSFPGFLALMPQASGIIRAPNEPLITYKNSEKTLGMGEYCKLAESFLPDFKELNLCTKTSTLSHPANGSETPLPHDTLAQPLPHIKYGVYVFFNTGIPTPTVLNFRKDTGDLEKDVVRLTKPVVNTENGDQTVEVFTHYPAYMWQKHPQMRVNSKKPRQVTMMMLKSQEDGKYDTTHKGGVLNPVILSSMVQIATRPDGGDPELMRANELDDFTTNLYKTMDQRRRATSGARQDGEEKCSGHEMCPLDHYCSKNTKHPQTCQLKKDLNHFCGDDKIGICKDHLICKKNSIGWSKCSEKN